MKYILGVFVLLIALFVVAYLFGDEWISGLLDAAANGGYSTGEPSAADSLFN